jgi:hypothetical protein
MPVQLLSVAVGLQTQYQARPCYVTEAIHIDKRQTFSHIVTANFSLAETKKVRPTRRGFSILFYMCHMSYVIRVFQCYPAGSRLPQMGTRHAARPGSRRVPETVPAKVPQQVPDGFQAGFQADGFQTLPDRIPGRIHGRVPAIFQTASRQPPDGFHTASRKITALFQTRFQAGFHTWF